MNKSANKYSSVDEYIAKSDAKVQGILQNIRNLIKKAAPNSIESIAYGMPAYKQNGKPLVYFAAFPNHIGFYATPTAHEGFSKELAKYKQGKGSVQFPLNQPIPYDIISRMTTFKANSL